jgi:hypothetical protein
MQFCSQIVALRRNILPPASPSLENGGIMFLRNIDYVPTKLHSVATQRTTILLIIAFKNLKVCNINFLGLPTQVYAYISAVLI